MRPSHPLLAALALAALAPATTPAATATLSPDLQAEELAPGIVRIVAWAELAGYGRTPANALAVVSGHEALLLNALWDDGQADAVAGWLARRFGARVAVVVPTHWHRDTMGGLAALHRRGATSWAHQRTAAQARARGLEVPQRTFTERQRLRVGDRTVELAFLGGGHTADNVVAWLPAERILFGGCLVKSADARGPGNVEDAVLGEWPATIRAVQDAFPDARLVIPGHGDPGGPELLNHTLAVLRGG